MQLKNLRNCCIGELVNKYRLEIVDVLSPYLSPFFFDKLKELKPHQVYITTDAGCPTVAMQSVEKKLGKNLKHIKLGQCAGIVHGKCYLFHWKNKETNRYKRLLLWGSCNATEGGFVRNAEIFSWLQLSKLDSDQRSLITKYFESLRSNDKGAEATEINIHALTVNFPKIKLFEPESKTFDLWVQTGRLCHPFPNDPSFRHLRVVLKNKITQDDILSTELRKNNIGINQQATISYDYLRQTIDKSEDEELDDNFTTIWKSRYFVDTIFGFWTSKDCFEKKGENFHKQNILQRENEIIQISKANSQQREKWNEEFLSVIKSINEAIPNPSEYFHYKNGAIDIERYKKLFENQLNRDFIRSKDSWFRHGYVSGYDFPEVPPLREFSSNWSEFIKSFSNSLFFEVNKSNGRSWLAQTIRDKTDIGKAVDSDEFLGMLQNKWKFNQEVIEFFYCTNE